MNLHPGRHGDVVAHLLDRCDLRVDGCDRSALVRGCTDRCRVPLKRTEDQCVGHALRISSCLCVGECLVGSSLLETVWVL